MVPTVGPPVSLARTLGRSLGFQISVKHIMVIQTSRFRADTRGPYFEISENGSELGVSDEGILATHPGILDFKAIMWTLNPEP